MLAAAKLLLFCMGVCMILGSSMQSHNTDFTGRGNSLIEHLSGRKMLITLRTGKVMFIKPAKGGEANTFVSSIVGDADLRLVPSGPDPLHHSRNPTKPRNVP